MYTNSLVFFCGKKRESKLNSNNKKRAKYTKRVILLCNYTLYQSYDQTRQ